MLAYGRPIRSKTIGGCDVAILEVVILYALVLNHALRLTICSCILYF